MTIKTNMNHQAFTLAEVLITIVVIGIVAAMTLPTVIQKHRKQVVETSLARFYTNIQQAVRLAEAEYGDKLYWDEMGNSCTFKDENAENLECEEGSETALQWYNKYLAKYLKSTNVEAAIGSNKHTAVYVYFIDGTAMVLYSDGTNFYLNPKYINDKDRTQEFGTVAFPFSFDKTKGFVPYNYNGTYKQTCKQGSNGNGCTMVIAENGWKIPDNYPFRF